MRDSITEPQRSLCITDGITFLDSFSEVGDGTYLTERHFLIEFIINSIQPLNTFSYLAFTRAKNRTFCASTLLSLSIIAVHLSGGNKAGDYINHEFSIFISRDCVVTGALLAKDECYSTHCTAVAFASLFIIRYAKRKTNHRLLW